MKRDLILSFATGLGGGLGILMVVVIAITAFKLVT